MIADPEKIGLQRGLIADRSGHDISDSYDRFKLPFVFVVAPGALFNINYLQPLGSELIDRKQKVIIPELDSSDVTKTFDDDAATVLDAMEDHENIVLVTHSRGVETAPRALQQLASKDELGRVAAVIMMNTAGPHGFDFQPASVQVEKRKRYTKEFEEGVIKISDESYVFDPEVAEKVFCNEVRDQYLASLAISGMRLQRSAEISATPLPDLPKGIPLFVVQGALDKAINLRRAIPLMEAYTGRRSIVFPDAGHMLPLEQPDNTANLLVKLAVNSTILKSPN